MGDSHISSNWSESSATAIQVCESLSSITSLLAIILMVHKVRTDSIKSKLILTNRFLLILFSINAVLLIFYLIGLSAERNASFCRFQALMIQWTGLAELLWVTAMTYHMYGWIVLKKNPDVIVKGLKYDVAVVIVVAGIVSFTLLAYPDIYGPSETWCWISPERPLVRFICYYAIQLTSMALILGMVVYLTLFLKVTVSIGGASQELSSLQLSETRIRQKLISYVMVFVFVWFFALLDGFVTLVSGKPQLTTSLLQAIIIPAQGFLLSLFFGNLVKNCERLFHKVAHKQTDDMHGLDQKYRINDSEMTTKIVQNDNTLKYVNRLGGVGGNELSKYSIFISTFNLGEAPTEALKASMDDWILPGHDIYVLGFQECLDVQGARQLVSEAIGGIAEYSMFTAEIGSTNTKLGYHGYIAITVFIRNKDLKEGNVRPCLSATPTIATGTNLIVTTGSNKGGVGIPLQIHDTTIGFIVTHLPSDSKGISKLSKRNGSAHKILGELNLGPESVGFDCHFQHDHMVFMGDLNYRMDTSGVGGGVSTLTGVSVACLVEKHSIEGDPNWFKRKYNLLRVPTDPKYPSQADKQLFHNARQAARGAWQSVLRADELHMIMEDGDAFYGFTETMPCFPPTYKRKIGPTISCGDYSDPIVMIRGYSNTGEIEEDIVGMQVVPTATAAPIIATTTTTTTTTTSAAAGAGAEEGDSDIEEEGGGEKGSVSNRKQRRTNVSLEPTPSESSDNSQRVESVSSKKKVRKTLSAKEAKKIRPPSYTDRILLHSQEDRKSQVHIQAYDFCDTMTVSDHKPVSMVLSLHVNPNVKFHDNALDLNTITSNSPVDKRASVAYVQGGYAKSRQNISSALYEITVVDMSVKFNNSAGFDADLVTDDDDMDDDTEDDMTDAGSVDELEAGWGKDADPDTRRSWSQRVHEQERDRSERKLRKSETMQVVDKIKEEKKRAKKDKTIANCVIVCPLPTKDPLIIYKKMNDIAEAFNVQDTGILREYEEIAKRMVQPSKSTNVIVPDYTNNPLAGAGKSSTPEKIISSSETDHSRTIIDTSFFSRPASVFPWQEINIPKAVDKRKSFSTGESLPYKTVNMKFCCALSPELGGNIMFKLVNAAEVDLGECVLCISHLLPTDQKTIMKCNFSTVPISSGSQRRGDASMTVLVRLLSDESI